MPHKMHKHIPNWTFTQTQQLLLNNQCWVGSLEFLQTVGSCVTPSFKSRDSNAQLQWSHSIWFNLWSQFSRSFEAFHLPVCLLPLARRDSAVLQHIHQRFIICFNPSKAAGVTNQHSVESLINHQISVSSLLSLVSNKICVETLFWELSCHTCNHLF